MPLDKSTNPNTKKSTKNGYIWSEPGAFSRRYRRYKILPWGYHVVAAGMFLFILSIPLWSPAPNKASWWTFLGFACVCVAATYLVALLDASTSATISVVKKGIEVNSSVLFTSIPILIILGYRRRTYPWSDIGSATIRPETIGKKEFIAIELRNTEGELIETIGATKKKPDMEGVAEFMKREGEVLARMG